MTTPRIVILRTRSTLEEVGVDALDLVDYHRTGQRLRAGGFLEWVPQLAELADTREEVFSPQVGERPALVASERDLLDLARQVRTLLLEESVDAVVVTHGTNGLEETALLLWAAVEVPAGKRVVVTGAMRPAGALGTDGPRNIWSACRAAADASEGGRGCVTVVMNDVIFRGDGVAKSHTSSLGAFTADDRGPVGVIEPTGHIDWLSAHVPRPPAWLSDALVDAVGLADVPLASSWTGHDGRILRAIAHTDPAGLVIAGRGNGHPLPQEIGPLIELTERGVAVCIASRASDGRVILPAIGRDHNWLAAGPRRAWSARLLLSVGLNATDDRAAIQALLDRREA